MHQAVGKRFLLACGFQFGVDGIQFDVRGGSIERDLLTSILEAQVGSIYTRACGFGVLALGIAENKGLHADATHRGLTRREAVRVTHRGANPQIWNVGVFRRRQRRIRLLQIRVCQLDRAAIALCQVHHRGQ